MKHIRTASTKGARCLRFLVGLVLVATSVTAFPQFNLDLDVGFGPPEGGNGAPSAGFPGAAGQAGYWNRIDASGPSVPTMLRALDGSVSSVRIVATGGIGSSGGSGYTGNTGDFNLLLNDYSYVLGASLQIEYHFSGLEPGIYRIFSYAVRAGPPYPYDAYVTVPGALVPTKLVTGPMPGNQFILGVTHSSHDITITGDSFQVEVLGPLWPYAHANGFQIVAVVPEPTTGACVAGAMLLLIVRKRIRPTSAKKPIVLEVSGHFPQ